MALQLFTSCGKKVRLFLVFFAMHSATIRRHHAHDPFSQASSQSGPIHSPFLPQLSPILLTRNPGPKNKYFLCRRKGGCIALHLTTAVLGNKFRSKKHLIKNPMTLKILGDLALQIFLRNLERVIARRGSCTKKVQNDKDFQNFLLFKNITENTTSFDPNSEYFLNVSPPEVLFEGSPPYSENIMTQQPVEKLGHKKLSELDRGWLELSFKEQSCKKILSEHRKKFHWIKEENKHLKPMLSLFLRAEEEKRYPKNQQPTIGKNSKGIRPQKSPLPGALDSNNLEKIPQFYQKEKPPSFSGNEISLQSLLMQWSYRERVLLKKYEQLKLQSVRQIYLSVPPLNKAQTLYQLEVARNTLGALQAEQRLCARSSLNPEFLRSQLIKLSHFDRFFSLVFPLKFREFNFLLEPTPTNAHSCNKKTPQFCSTPLKPYNHPRIFSRNLPKRQYDKKNPVAKPKLISPRPVCPYSDSMARFFEQIGYFWDQISKIFCCFPSNK